LTPVSEVEKREGSQRGHGANPAPDRHVPHNVSRLSGKRRSLRGMKASTGNLAACYHPAMPNRSRKPPEDENEAAVRVVATLTGDRPKEKNPAAVELGRLGGKVGGPARAAKLSKKRRSAIARKAAVARWGKPPAPRKRPAKQGS
jgi:hypothetical protein